MLILDMINRPREVAGGWLRQRAFFTVNLPSHLTFNQDSGFKERAVLKVGATLMTNITANVSAPLGGKGGAGTGCCSEC